MYQGDICKTRRVDEVQHKRAGSQFDTARPYRTPTYISKLKYTGIMHTYSPRKHMEERGRSKGGSDKKINSCSIAPRKLDFTRHYL